MLEGAGERERDEGPPGAGPLTGRVGGLLRRAQRSLIVKITVPTVLVVAVISLVSAWRLAASFEATHEAYSNRRAERFATAVKAALRREMEEGHTAVGPFLRLLCDATYKTGFVTDRRGRVHFSCSAALADEVIDPRRLAVARVVHDGVTWIRRVHPVPGGPSCVRCHTQDDPVGYVGVDSPLEEAEAEVREQRRANVRAGVLQAIALSMVLALVQLVLVHRPISRLTATVGRIRSGDLAARTASVSGDELGVLGRSIDDMALSLERAKAELERTYRSELAQAAKLGALGRTISSVAHEIKNPLAGIIGALRVLDGDASIPPQAHGIISKVHAQVDRLSRTVVAALDFARPARSAAADVDLADLLDRVVFFVENQAAEQRVRIHRRLGAGPVRARVDPDLTKQVFLNLLLNGIEAMPGGGELEVAIAPAGAGLVEVRFTDQGPGIPDEHLDRVFSPFFTTKSGGTGLGLHVVRQIVETHHGRVLVENAPGRGATFVVQLPATGGDGDVAG